MPQNYFIVTGASSGIGEKICEQLAQKGYHLILVARRKERMDELAKRLKEQHQTQSLVIACDLSQPQSAPTLMEEIKNSAVSSQVIGLVNNAGFGLHKLFLESELDRLNQMIQLNITALTELSYLFGEWMVAKKQKGYLMQVASVVGYSPTPQMAVYAATKAYVFSFGLALHHELKKQGIRVTTVCPGYTLTEFSKVARVKADQTLAKFGMSAAKVARIGLKGLFKGKAIVVTGVSNKITAGFLKIAPENLKTWSVDKVLDFANKE